MREIKFRGLSDTGNWYYGGIIPHYTTGYSLITNPEGNDASCKNGTIGQFTGLQDKKGNDIYEGDILKMENVGWEYTVVQFHNGTFAFFTSETNYLNPLVPQYWLEGEVIGNIYENSDLVVAASEADA